MAERGKKKETPLVHKPLSGYERLPEKEWAACEKLMTGYKTFLDEGKTERCCVAYAEMLAKDHGFKPYVRGMKIAPGDKIYRVNRRKSMLLAVIGKQPLAQGARMVAAHIDAPRIDLKPCPLYEDSGQALLKTHYYGGVKKYQWLATPLELRGVVCKTDGTTVQVRVGADPFDPVLVITDILPHLGDEQRKKVVSDAFPAESLNVLTGNRPESGEGEDRVKLRVLKLLNQKYGITEEDFMSAELSLVPAQNARDVGLDETMLGAYGHDDRSCSYTALKALLDVGTPEHTAVCLLADKEEIGSEGVTGLRSAHFDTFMEDLCEAQKCRLSVCYENSFCLSGDVCNAFDPNFADAHDKRNNVKMGYGVGVFKYTGSRGKSGASDATAELVAKTRALFEKAGVYWQMGELGKVDLGGGGTVAMYLAQRNIDVIDVGVPVLCMHAPFEIVSKLDVYMAYKAFLAAYQD